MPIVKVLSMALVTVAPSPVVKITAGGKQERACRIKPGGRALQ